MAPFPSFKQENSWADLFLWKHCESITLLGIGFYFIFSWKRLLSSPKKYHILSGIQFLPCFVIQCKKDWIFSLLIIQTESLSLYFGLLASHKLKTKTNETNKQTKNPFQLSIFINFYIYLPFPWGTYISLLLTPAIHVLTKVLENGPVRPPDTHLPLVVCKPHFVYRFLNANINLLQKPWHKACKSKRVQTLTCWTLVWVLNL